MKQLFEFGEKIYMPPPPEPSGSQGTPDGAPSASARVSQSRRRPIEDPERISLQEYVKIVDDLYGVMEDVKCGCQRLDFVKDMLKVDAKRGKRCKAIGDDLKAKGELVRRIYKFEKQIFIVQGKLDGTIPQAHDLHDEIEFRDKKGRIAKQLVDLSDPNHRLKNYIKYQRPDDLIELEIRNDELKREIREASKKQSTITVSGGDEG